MYTPSFTVEFWAQATNPLTDTEMPVSKTYLIGAKNFHSFTSFSAAINTAFGKTLPGGDSLYARVTYTTKYRGENSVVLIPTNYTAGLTAIQAAIDATKMDLDTLLA